MLHRPHIFTPLLNFVVLRQASIRATVEGHYKASKRAKKGKNIASLRVYAILEFAVDVTKYPVLAYARAF